MKLLSEIAINFAANINCKKDGCLECKTCKTILKGKNPNLYVLEPVGNSFLVEEIEGLIYQMSISSINNEFKIAIIKEADLMGGLGGITFNKMLKTLEDPPDEKCIFILLTEDIDAIIPTVKSRCQAYSWIFNSNNSESYSGKFNNIENEVHNLLKVIISDRKNIFNALNFSIKVSNFIPEFISEIVKEQKKAIEIVRKSGFDEVEINKIIKKMDSNYERKVKKATGLIINDVFDIITAYLEDITDIIAGAKKEALHYNDNYNIIIENYKLEDINKYINLLEALRKNKIYISSEINYEIALDRIILGFVQS